MNTIDLKGVNILNTSTVGFQSSGLSLILDIFYECAKINVKGTIDNVFIEYSTISSMLVDSKMLGYACLGKVKDATFGVNVVRYAEPIIKHVQCNKISLYHHKDFISAKLNESFYKAGHKFISSVCFGNNNKKRKVIEKYSIDSINIIGNEISHKDKYWAISYDIEYKDFLSLIDEYPKERNNESLEDFFAVIHLLYDKYFWPNSLPQGTNSVFFGIPTIGAIVEGNNISGQGGVFIYFTYSCDEADIRKFIDKISIELDYAVKSITLNVLANAGLVLAQKISKESIKSAISAIMARNMSHNLGSHFISNTKNYFNNLAEIEGTASQLRKDYRGIRHTLQYIQERMDFIATIVSTDSFPYGPVNVKSQIFDELTPDEFGKRHEKATTNFLLDYIVFSEDISKQSSKVSKIKLSLELISEGGENFGGNENENETAKHELAKINFAIPGGVLGRHAIFTIIENIIRNSSKHDKSRIPKDGLKISIKIGDGFIIIFDNKNNAKEKIDGENEILIEHLIKRYQGVKILSNGSIDKSNKGLKEILISALWLNNISLADWFSEYESISLNEKIKKLSDVVRIVSVDGHGNESLDGKNLGYYIKLDQYKEIHPINESDVNDEKIEYSIISKVKADIITAKENYEVVISGNSETNINSEPLRLSHIYPRFYVTNNVDASPEDIMSKIIVRNLGISMEGLQKTTIHIETPKEESGSAHNCLWHKDDNFRVAKDDVIFKNHFSNINSLEAVVRVLDEFNNAAYIDSISGGDFTGTLTQPFFLGDELNRLKVIESALTEFAIIDERIYKNYGRGGVCETQNIEADGSPEISDDTVYKVIKNLLEQNRDRTCIQQSIKKQFNISLAVRKLIPNNEYEIRKEISTAIKEYNDNTRKNNESRTNHNANVHKNKALHKMIKRKRLHIYDINEKGYIIGLDGKPIVNITNDVNKKLCTPMFVSIHLSIIEKIIKENNGVKASDIMKNLRKLFGGVKFITIHSGRGNLSAELETELKDYAFLSLSAIQAAMDDSKYFLSQLLYNNCYIGKGRINQK